ncbi:MAG: GGDEF domain-containing protein [Planctomycetota bacterium]
MTRPGFRKGRSSGGRSKAADSDGFLSSSLFSQAQILHLMKNEFARARRHGMPMGVVMMQVDRLAQLVDLYGSALRLTVKDAVARLVREKTRGSDLLGTTNDDRYLLVMPHTDLGQTRIVAERLHQLFNEVDVRVDGRALQLTVSIGMTSCDDQGTLFFDTLLSQTETALEYAERYGGDQVISFGETQLRSDDLPLDRRSASAGDADDDAGDGAGDGAGGAAGGAADGDGETGHLRSGEAASQEAAAQPTEGEAAKAQGEPARRNRRADDPPMDPSGGVNPDGGAAS